MAKTEVYSQIAEDWLEHSREQGQVNGEQERLRATAMKFVGTIESGQSQRAENARSGVRARIARRYE